MKIISIARKQSGASVPELFVVGAPLIINGEVVIGPDVTEIKYFALSTVYDKVFRGPVYVVKFKDSTVRRIIPADNNIIDIAVETAQLEKQPENEAKLPNLPE
jgi:hypothetical protein